MFGIGPTELIVVLVLALIVVGPERLPTLAGQIGKAIRDFRQMSGDVTGEFQRAFQLDEPQQTSQVLTDEVIGASATPNGTSETYPELTAQVIPDEPPLATPAPFVWDAPASADAPATETTTTAVAPAEPLVATKADPLIGASFLDDPEPEPEPTPEPAFETISATSVYEGMPVTTFNPPPLPGDEPAAPTNTVADAWDAVLTTDATISLPEPATDELQSMTIASTAVAVADPEPDTLIASAPVFADPAPRPRIDPTAEVTIREVIEGQVAAEAFRERRRIAKYQRRK